MKNKEITLSVISLLTTTKKLKYLTISDKLILKTKKYPYTKNCINFFEILLFYPIVCVSEYSLNSNAF